MEVLQGASDWFWNEEFWLPENTTWKSLERDETIFIPTASDLWLTLPMAVGLFILRLLWERFIATPLGRWYHISEKEPRKANPDPHLEEAFRKQKRAPSKDTVTRLSKQLDLTPRQIERWWRIRRVQDKPHEMQRFRETSWRFIFYLVIFYYGLYILWDTPWLWDTRNCWYGYPRQHMPDTIYWYYMVELGFYISLIFSLFMDNQRKDFVEMMVHHFATITLMVFSWSVNMVRVGSLVLVVHDAVDYWLEGAKLAKYCKYHKLTDALFVIFTVMWFVTRIVFYPLQVLHTTWVEANQILGNFPSFYVFNALLATLQVLHVIWFYMILQMVFAYILRGQIDKDGRSDTEPETEEEDDLISKRVNGVTGTIVGGRGDAGAYVANGNAKKR